MQSIIDTGVALIVIIQTSLTGLVGFFNLFTSMGDEEFYLLALPFLYWCVESKLRLRVGIYFVVSVVVNETLKLAFHQPRPFWVSTRVQLLTDATGGFGAPSGHAQHAVVFWGTIAAYFGRAAYWLAAVVMMGLIAFSRIYLGVHFIHDALLGLIVGALLLMLMLRQESVVLAWFRERALRQQITAIWVLSFVGIALGLLTLLLLNLTWTFPADWINNAAIQAPDDLIGNPSAATVVTMMAVFSGLLTGHLLLEDRGGFDASGSVGQKFGRFLLGAIGVVIIWQGLDLVFALLAEDETVLGYLLRYIRYFSVGIWVGMLAPLVFKKLRLA